LHRRALQRTDERHPSAAAPAAQLLRATRGVVIDRGWHDRSLIGPLLRRIDRHLP